VPDQIFRLTITSPEGTRQQELRPGLLTIGRQPGNDLLLDSAQVSRSHARLACTQAGCQLTDLNSSNGTYHNGERIPPQVPLELNPGDTIRIGPFEILFESLPAPAVAAPEPAPPEPVSEAGPEPQAELQPKPQAQPEPRPEPEQQRTPARKRPAGPPPTPPSDLPASSQPDDSGLVPPGLSLHSQRLIKYLPGIYHTDFMERFLGIFEAILTPIEWNIDNFDLYLNPYSAPADFLAWLANWYQASFDSTWSEVQRRQLLADAHQIYARRGTRWALGRVLEIYTGVAPKIDDQDEKLEPFTFKVHIPLKKRELDTGLVEALIDAHKPAHTTYEVSYA
jgi:phage tail-like protein